MKTKHPQAPPFANIQEIEAFLARPLIARFSCHNNDGTIHISPIYYIYEDGEFFFGTQELSRKVKNIRRDDLVSVLIDTIDPIMQAVMVYGNAILDYEDVVTKRVKIIERYFETRTDAEGFVERLTEAWKTVIIRLKPTKIVSFDYSKPFSID